MLAEFNIHGMVSFLPLSVSALRPRFLNSVGDTGMKKFLVSLFWPGTSAAYFLMRETSLEAVLYINMNIVFFSIWLDDVVTVKISLI